MKVLITGSAGAIGQNLVKGMGERHELRGLDRVPTPGLDDALVGEITDFDLVFEATKGMEAVIHLVNVGAEWEQALQSMVGTYNVFEANGHAATPRQLLFRDQGFWRKPGLYVLVPQGYGGGVRAHRQLQSRSRPARTSTPAQPRRLRPGFRAGDHSPGGEIRSRFRGL